MQETALNFTGLALTPYSDVSPDGQLSACRNLEMYNGSLRPALLEGTEYRLPETHADCVLSATHTTSDYRHFIFLSKDRGSVYWSDITAGELKIEDISVFDSPVKEIRSVGNTLVVINGKGIHYSLFKNGVYKPLGQKPPETVIQFGLVSELYRLEKTDYSVVHKDILTDKYEDVAFTETGYMEIRKEDQSDLSLKENNMISLLVNEAAQTDRIVYPVFVRYAYRMYDGESYIMQSSPVLLVPNTDIAPVVTYRAIKDSPSDSSVLFAGANASLITYNILESELEDWKDVIVSVDIFMSDQIYSRKTDCKITHTVRFSETEAAKSINYGIFSELSDHTGPKTYYDTLMGIGHTDSDETGHIYQLYGENMKDTDFLKRISEASVFYKVRSLEQEDIRLNETCYLFDSEVPGTTLSNINFQETLPDDYQSHDLLIPGCSYTYNERLNVGNLVRVMFGGYNTSSMVQNVQTESSEMNYYTVYTHIKKDNKDIVVRNTCSGIEGMYPIFLFYPDPGAFKMTVVKSADPQQGVFYDGWIINLQEHSFLNGAYFFDGFKGADSAFRRIHAPETTSSVIREQNKMATSGIGNPFHFPLQGRNTVGVGSIMGLSSIVTPLSEGQFGQFPLMIFTDEGNYAASVNSEGLYSSVYPMQRDVCINPESITPADYTIVYISEKGVMSADGNNITCISESLDGVPDKFGEEPIPEPQQFFKSCRIAYDYASGRLIFGSGGNPSVFIRSKDGFWSTADWGSFSSVLNVYPYSYIQRDLSIVRLDKTYSYSGEPVKGHICTRPIKMDTFSLKKVLSVALQGIYSAPQPISIYVSNNGNDWFMVGKSCSSKILRLGGRSYKYWRFTVETRLLPSENISMLRLQFEQRKERRFR